MKDRQSLIIRAGILWLKFLTMLLVLVIPAVLACLLSCLASGRPSLWSLSSGGMIIDAMGDVLESLPFAGVLLKAFGVVIQEQTAAWPWQKDVLKLLMLLPVSAIAGYVISRGVLINPRIGGFARESRMFMSAVFYSINMSWSVICAALIDFCLGRGMKLAIWAVAAVMMLLWLGFCTRSAWHGGGYILREVKAALCALPGLLPLYVIAWFLNMFMDIRIGIEWRLIAFAVLMALMWFYYTHKDSLIFMGMLLVVAIGAYSQRNAISELLYSIVLR